MLIKIFIYAGLIFGLLRAEVELETFNAPRRRVDNEISRLTETVSALLMHCKILDRVMETYHDKLWRVRFMTAATLLGKKTYENVHFLSDDTYIINTLFVHTLQEVLW